MASHPVDNNQDDEDWGPNNNDGAAPQVVTQPRAQRPTFEVKTFHFALEADSTPHTLPKQHVHSTFEYNNWHMAKSTTTLKSLMDYYGMSGTHCSVTAYDSTGCIKHAVYGVDANQQLGKIVRESGLTVVLWDRSPELEGMSNTLWCDDDAGEGPQSKVVLEYQVTGTSDSQAPHWATSYLW